MDKGSNKVQNILSVLLFAFVVLYLILLIFGLDKGFDFTDEGLYALRNSKLQAIDYSHLSADHLITKNIFFFIEPNILNLRILRLVLSLITIAISSFAFYTLSSKKYNYKPNIFFLISLISAGILFPHSDGLMISYNSYTFLIITNCISLFLISYTSEKWIFSFILGILLSFCFFTKFTSFAAIFVLFILLFWLVLEKKNRKLMILAFLSGLLICNIILFIGPLTEKYLALLHFGDTINNASSSNSTYSSANLFRNFFTYIKDYISQLIYAMAMVLLAIFALDKSKSKLLRIIALIINITFILFYSKQFILPIISYNGGSSLLANLKNTDLNALFNGFAYIQHSNIYIFLLGLAFFIFIARKTNTNNSVLSYLNFQLIFKKPISSLLVITFAIMPLIISLGHSYILMMHTLGAVFFLFMAMFILYIDSKKKQILIIINMGLFLLLTSAIFSTFYHPYRKLPLNKQKYEYNNIKYDKQTYDLLCDIDSVLTTNNFNPEQGIIGLSNRMTGYIFIANSFSPGGVVWTEEQDYKYYNYLENLDTNSQLPYIFINDSLYLNNIKTKMKTVGIDFNNCYKKVYESTYFSWYYWKEKEFLIYKFD